MTMLLVALFAIGSLGFSNYGQQPDEKEQEKEVREYELNLRVQPAEGGEVEGDGSYKPGTEVTITATAAEGYEFLQWTDDMQGFVVSSEDSFEYTMPEEDVTLSAIFVELMD